MFHFISRVLTVFGAHIKNTFRLPLFFQTVLILQRHLKKLQLFLLFLQPFRNRTISNFWLNYADLANVKFSCVSNYCSTIFYLIYQTCFLNQESSQIFLAFIMKTISSVFYSKFQSKDVATKIYMLLKISMFVSNSRHNSIFSIFDSASLHFKHYLCVFWFRQVSKISCSKQLFISVRYYKTSRNRFHWFFVNI